MREHSQQMSPGCKIVLWIAGLGFLGLVVLGVLIGPTLYEIFQGMTRDPAEVEAIARGISPHGLPAGFSPEGGFEYDDVKMAMLSSGEIGLVLWQKLGGDGVPEGVEDRVPAASERGEETAITIDLEDGRSFEGTRSTTDRGETFYSFPLEGAGESYLTLTGPEGVLTDDRVREILTSME